MDDQPVEYGEVGYDEGDEFSTRALVVAIVAALAGAAAWAGILWLTDYEVGFIAWGIGGLIGFAAVAAGGRGSLLAIFCGVLALAAIFGGKFGVAYTWNYQAETEYLESLTEENYASFKLTAFAWAALPAPVSNGDAGEFMLQHGFVVDPQAGYVTKEELADFRTYVIPTFSAVLKGEMDFEEWRELAISELELAREEQGSLMSLILQSLDALDLLFLFLGVSTAYGLVRKAG